MDTRKRAGFSQRGTLLTNSYRRGKKPKSPALRYQPGRIRPDKPKVRILHPITIPENLRSFPNEIECEQCGLEARRVSVVPAIFKLSQRLGCLWNGIISPLYAYPVALTPFDSAALDPQPSALFDSVLIVSLVSPGAGDVVTTPFACAVKRARNSSGRRITRQLSLQPVATGAFVVGNCYGRSLRCKRSLKRRSASAQAII